MANCTCPDTSAWGCPDHRPTNMAPTIGPGIAPASGAVEQRRGNFERCVECRSWILDTWNWREKCACGLLPVGFKGTDFGCIHWEHKGGKG